MESVHQHIDNLDRISSAMNTEELGWLGQINEIQPGILSSIERLASGINMMQEQVNSDDGTELTANSFERKRLEQKLEILTGFNTTLLEIYKHLHEVGHYIKYTLGKYQLIIANLFLNKQVSMF
jgi:hypothetical protein